MLQLELGIFCLLAEAADLVMYLAGKCRVDETPKGWFISLIQADPLEEIEKGRKAKRDRAEKDEEDRK